MSYIEVVAAPGSVVTVPDSFVLDRLQGEVNPDSLIIEKGAGLLGLTEWEDNRKWAPFLNHILLTARLAIGLADKIDSPVDKNLILNSILIGHSPRRFFEEAKVIVEQSEVDVEDTEDPLLDTYRSRYEAGPEGLSLIGEIFDGRPLPEKVLKVVEANKAGDPDYSVERITTLEEGLSLYADLRTNLDYVTLNDRFAGLRERSRVPEEKIEELERWSIAFEKELFSQLDLPPGDVSTDSFPMPKWERYLRRLYINDAEEGIFKEIGLSKNTDREFPGDSWWGKYVIELYDQQNGIPYKSSPSPNKPSKPVGVQRAAAFAEWLENYDFEGENDGLPRESLFQL